MTKRSSKPTPAQINAEVAKSDLPLTVRHIVYQQVRRALREMDFEAEVRRNLYRQIDQYFSTNSEVRTSIEMAMRDSLANAHIYAPVASPKEIKAVLNEAALTAIQRLAMEVFEQLTDQEPTAPDDSPAARLVKWLRYHLPPE